MGRAIALRFAQQGANVAITDISGTRLREAEEEIAAASDPGRVLAVRSSVIDEHEANSFCEELLAHFSTVDILVNVVGGIADKVFYRPFLEITEERWQGTFDVNLSGGRFMTRALAPVMLQKRYGRIINVSSVDYAGERGHADYSASKAAVVALTRVLALEFAPHLTVNCIAPGIINTRAAVAMDSAKLQELKDRNLMKRLGEPEDIANAALFLASDEASFITGEVLSVSGGIWPAL
jgi:NAD(P)-dependent dehydrogenase (short-subunit alcohol dehydrogenase family)